MRDGARNWGPGKFDAELVLDGKASGPDGLDAATLIPPAFGLAGVNLHTWTGWGSVTHWNAFVANLEMHGKGTFFDPRLDDAVQVPDRRARGVRQRAQRSGSDHAEARRRCTSTSSRSRRRARPRDSFDAAAAARGEAALRGQGAVRDLSRAAALHRAGLEHAHARGDRHRRLPGESLTRRALSHRAAGGALDATRRAASITTAASRRCSTSSITTTRISD